MGEKFNHNNSSGNACHAGCVYYTFLLPKCCMNIRDNCNTQKKLKHWLHIFGGMGGASGKELRFVVGNAKVANAGNI